MSSLLLLAVPLKFSFSRNWQVPLDSRVSYLVPALINTVMDARGLFQVSVQMVAPLASLDLVKGRSN